VVVAVRELKRVVRVALHDIREQLTEVAPVAAAVEGKDDRVEHRGAADLAAVRATERAGVEAREQRTDLRERRVHPVGSATGERTLRSGEAVGQVGLQRVLESL